MISDAFTRPLADAAQDSQRYAHRPGTNRGRESAVHLYLSFCRRCNIHYTRVNYSHICWYIEYLARHYTSPASISNAISHKRTFYLMSSLSTRTLYHNRVRLALRAVAITIRHAPKSSPAVTPDVLRAALVALKPGPGADALHMALLLMFMGFMRQSSVAPPSVSAFDHCRSAHIASRPARPP